MKTGFYILSLLLIIGCPSISQADPLRLMLQSDGNGAFVLTGQNAAGVQSLNIEIGYNAGLLTSPVVQIEGGELAKVPEDSAGRLFLSVFRPVMDANLRILLYFSSKADGPGGIQHILVSSVTRTSYRPPSEGSDADRQDPDLDGTADIRQNASSSAASKEASLAGAASVPAQERRVIVEDEPSILQRFRSFKGQKDLGTFMSLFERTAGGSTVQEPAIALSDGTTPVRIRIKVQRGTQCGAGIALTDASLLSKETDEKGMSITVLPEKGTWDARVGIVTDQQVIEYPMVVAPPVDLPANITETTFYAALQSYILAQTAAKPGENAVPLLEYIFTANYLAGRREKVFPSLARDVRTEHKGEGMNGTNTVATGPAGEGTAE